MLVFALCHIALLSSVSLAQQPLSVAGTDAGYLPGDACVECHREIAVTYARTGMARSFGRMRSDTPFPEGSYRHTASEQQFTMLKRDGKPVLQRSLTGFEGFGVEKQIDFWFGSGNHARSYFHQAASGRLVQMPVTWYAHGGWAMSPGYDRPDHAGFSRKVNYRCLFCHAGYPEIQAGADGWDGASHFPGRLTEGIDCQRCHGPGRAHVAAARASQQPAQVRASIVNPARLAPDRRTEVCLQCHLETTTLRLPSSILRVGRGVFSYRPGEPLGDYMLFFDHGEGHADKFEFVSEAYRMRQSQCFVKSGGALTCTTCHNPHDIPRGAAAIAQYSKACLSCHARITGSQHTATKDDCITCHMPKRQPVDAAHVRVADHRIVRHLPAAQPPRAVEQNDSNTAPYRGEVALYYPTSIPDTLESSLHLAVAQVRHQSNLKRGLPLLEALVARRPSHSGFYFELGEAWRSIGRLDKALTAHQQAVAMDRTADWRNLYALALTLASSGQHARAFETFANAAISAPLETVVLQSWGEALSRAGRLADAAGMFRKAIALDPDWADAHNNLGTSLLRMGDTKGAESALGNAVRLRPEVAAIRINLASFLARHSRFPEAKPHFEAALRMQPEFAEGHSAYGTALAANGQPQAAILQYQTAIRINPALPVSHNNLATLLARRGEIELALRAYREAIRYAPDYLEAHWKLGELLLGRGERDEAARHLRKAATSSDARIGNEAKRLLRETELP